MLFLYSTVWTYFQKKLYVFLRHTLEHWPLDASFRLFLETWLSYIQPWRYVSSTQKGNDGDKVVDWKWQNFVAENLLFYTLFLQKIILRFLRVELSSPKNSLMLYRISKVIRLRLNSLWPNLMTLACVECRFILSGILKK